MYTVESILILKIHTFLCLSFRHLMKINKLFKYLYEYQLTKHCLEGRLEGFKVSSWFLKIMKLVEYQIAKKCLDFHHCCRWLHHHYSWGCHKLFYLMKKSITLMTWFYRYKLLLLKRKEPLHTCKALVTELKRSSYGQVTIITVKSQSAGDVQSHS